jgi:Cellulase (glycosyl hydrolase family 5)
VQGRFRIAALAGALVAAVGAASPAPAVGDGAAPIASLARAAGPPARQPLQFAIQDDPEFLDHPERLDATLAEVRELGFTHVRLSAHWDQLTREPDATSRPPFAAASPGAYEQDKWQALDRAVTAATRQGLAVMIDVAFFAPRWATSGPGQFAPRPRYRIDRRAFADFAVAIAQRYSGHFAASPDDRQALPRVSLFTLWNEPNLAVFWTPQRRVLRGGRIALDSPHAYRRLVQAAYPAVKRARPDARVLVGGLASGPPWRPRARQAGIPAMRFVREMACVDARLRPLHTPDCRDFRPVPGDGLAAHPYSLGHPPYFRPRGDRVDTLTMGNLHTLALLLRRLAVRGRIAPGLQNIYLTEFGYLTPDSPDQTGDHLNPFPRVSPELQAVWETWAHELAWRTPQVRMFSHFLVRDTPCVLGSGLECIDWPSGFLYSDGEAKPARSALSAGLLVRPDGPGDLAVWGRLGDLGIRNSGVLEYDEGGQWRTVPSEDIRNFEGGGADGIFALRLRGLPADGFRIGAP